MAGLGSKDWSEIRQLWASGSLPGLADGPFLQQQLWGPLFLSPRGLPSLALQLLHKCFLPPRWPWVPGGAESSGAWL